MTGSKIEQSKTLITENHVKAALKEDKGIDAQLTSWTLKDFTNKGDNYGNVVTSIFVTYTTNNAEHSASYVVKVVIDRGEIGINNNMRMIMTREARFYKEVIPEMNSHLITAGEAPLGVPHCYHISLESGKEMIFMEDLRVRGFKMFDRKKGLNVAHATLILQALAKLHAASLLLQYSDRQEVKNNIKDLVSEDWLNNTKEARDFSQEIFSGSIGNTVAVLENVSGYERVIKWLRELSPKVVETLEDQLRKCEPFVVLCHGDCWTNNVLFRYDEGDTPVEVMLLDFQLTRQASPAIDLNYFMFTSFSGSERRSNIGNYLDTYYLTFRKALEAEGFQVPFSRQQLQEEYRDKHLYGLIFSLFVVPLVIADASAVPDIEDFLEGESVKDRKQNLIDMVTTNPRLRPRFLSIFDELLENSVIP